MARESRAISVSLSNTIADGLAGLALERGRSPGAQAAEIIESYLMENKVLPDEVIDELTLLRNLRDSAILKMRSLPDSPDITIQTIRACERDPEWMADYEKYVGADPFLHGNPRKANINQTIGSRIKSELSASDLLDENNKPKREKPPQPCIVQSYQLLAY